jgi:YidC/Oxa1 family membrane protein insertase
VPSMAPRRAGSGSLDGLDVPDIMKSQEDNEIEKRLLIAIALSMAILFVTPYIYQKLFPSPEAPVIEETARRTVEEALLPEARQPGEALREETVREAIPAIPETSAEPREIVVESESLRLRFSNVGAAIVSAQLRNYAGRDGELLELVPVELPAGYRRPLTLHAADPDAAIRLAEAVHEVSGIWGDRVRAPAELVFEFREEDLEVRKVVRVPEVGYTLGVEVDVRRSGRAYPYGVVLGTGIGEIAAIGDGDFRDPAVAFHQAGSVERYYEKDLQAGVIQLEGAPRWAAVDSKYFTFLLASPGSIRSLRMERRAWEEPATTPEGQATPVGLVHGVAGMDAGAGFVFFVGPKRAEELALADPFADSLINYGWFGLLVRPLLWSLKGIHGFVANYGWAIIILTFLINLALFPIRFKQIVSMQKMAALQPKMRSIQDKYKRMKRDDPRRQQMNQEVMALYKEHGVNPLGGCLPLLLQMPILFAFYRMLDASIELRGAPFMLWIQDLSKADPYYVTPIVMGLTMMAQQKMMPAAGDPTQRRVMMLLPILFTFFFLGVSSGLAIYFLFSNVFAMMFQLLLQRWKPELAPKPAAAAARKKKDA